MKAIQDFIDNRKIGLSLSDSWQMAGLSPYTKRIKETISYLLIALGVIFLISDFANEIDNAADSRVASELKAKEAEIVELRKIVATCLTGGDRPLIIGDTIWMCGAADTGIKVNASNI